MADISKIRLPDNEEYNIKDANAARSNHSHGNITNAGTITSDTSIASGDKLVIIDADNNKVARASISFDGSNVTKCLTQKGTWESFTNNAGTVTGSSLTADNIILGNGSSAIKSSGKTIATSITDVDTTVPTSKAVKTFVEGKGYVTTDENVKQSATTTANFRPILFGAKSSTDTSVLADTVTDTAYASTLLYARPQDGALYANKIFLHSGGSFGQLNMKTSSYNVMLRQDNANTYFLVTAQGDPDGSWTSARPLTIDNSTGVCSINGNAATASKINTSAKIGDTNKPVYIAADGTVTAISSTVGSAGLPIYSNAGVLTACSIPAPGAWWNTSTPRVPQIATDGVMEIGRYIDFHTTAASTNNCDVRLDAAAATQMKVFFKTASGSSFVPSTTNVTELGTSSLKWKNVNSTTITRTALKGVLTGTGEAASDKGSGVSPRYFPAKWTFNTGLTAADGDVFIIKLPTAGHSYGVFLSVDNGTNYYPISVSGTARLTTHYGNGYVIAVMFKSDGSTADMFPLAGGNTRSTVTGGCWQVLNYYDSGNTCPSAYCSTAAATAAKTATCTNYVLTTKSYLQVLITTANTSASALTLNINGKGAKPIYINGSASSSSNYTLPAGTYFVYYNGTNYYFRTDGKLTADITGSAVTATTRALTDNSTKIATTAFVQGLVGQINTILESVL